MSAKRLCWRIIFQLKFEDSSNPAWLIVVLCREKKEVNTEQFLIGYLLISSIRKPISPLLFYTDPKGEKPKCLKAQSTLLYIYTLLHFGLHHLLLIVIIITLWLCVHFPKRRSITQCPNKNYGSALVHFSRLREFTVSPNFVSGHKHGRLFIDPSIFQPSYYTESLDTFLLSLVHLGWMSNSLQLKSNRKMDHSQHISHSVWVRVGVYAASF